MAEGFSQADLARDLGVSRQAIQNGRRGAGLASAVRLRGVLYDGGRRWVLSTRVGPTVLGHYRPRWAKSDEYSIYGDTIRLTWVCQAEPVGHIEADQTGDRPPVRSVAGGTGPSCPRTRVIAGARSPDHAGPVESEG